MKYAARRSRLVAAFLVPLLSMTFGSCRAPGSQAEAITTQRPILSTDTATATEATLEVEVGLSRDSEGTFAIPSTIKWGIGEATELFFTLPAFREANPRRRTSTDYQDFELGLRHRFLEEAAPIPSAAFQTILRVPTDSDEDGLHSGEVEAFAGAVLSKSFGDATGSLFYEIGLLGNRGSHTDLEHTVALLAALPLGRGWGTFVEVAGIHVAEQHSDVALATLGASFAVSRKLVLDAGISLGLTDDTPDTLITLGFTTFPSGPNSVRGNQARYHAPVPATLRRSRL